MKEPGFRSEFTINLAGLVGGVQRRVQLLMNLATFGLKASEEFQPVDMESVDVAMKIRVSSDQRVWDEEQLRPNFRAWVLAGSLRDLIEVLSAVLEEARTICALWELSPGAGKVSVADWNARLGEEGQKFHSLGLPTKLAFRKREYAVALPEDKELDMLSINRARHCLVHRRGLVTTKDLQVSQQEPDRAIASWRALNPTGAWSAENDRAALVSAGIEPDLRVRWLKPQPIVETAGKVVEVDPRERPSFPEGGLFGIQIQRQEKHFLLGSAVEFNIEDLQQIGFAFFNTAKSLASALEDHGRDLGVAFSDQGDT